MSARPDGSGEVLAGGGGGASAPSGTGVVTATGGAFVDPVPSAATTRATLDAMQDVFAARGDLVRAGVGGVAERVAIGTATHVWTSDGTDAAWAAPTGGPPSGAAGGDLGGTYPSPTVTDLTIASEATGDLLYRSSGAVWTRLPVGTSGQRLKTSGSPAVPTWAALASQGVAASLPSSAVGRRGEWYFATDGTPTAYVCLQTGASTYTNLLVAAGATAAAARDAIGLGSLATASTVTASQISDSTAAGRALVTAADAAAQRTALAVVPSSATPLVESGAGAVGTSADYARADHVHPAAGGGGGGGGSGVPARLLAGFTDANHFTRAATVAADAVGGVGYSWLVSGYLSTSTAALRKVWEYQSAGAGWGFIIDGTAVKMYLAGINGGAGASTPFSVGLTLTAGAAFAVVIEYVAGELRATLNGGTVAVTSLTGSFAPPVATSVMGIGGDRVSAATYAFAEGKLAECDLISGALGDSAIQAFALSASTTYSFAAQFSAAQRAALKFSWLGADGGAPVRVGYGPLTTAGTLLASQPA